MKLDREAFAQRIEGMSPDRLRVLATELFSRLHNQEQRNSEPIAVIGMGCRLPGAPNPKAFRNLLYDGIDAISEVPAKRWDVDAFYDPNPDAPGRMYTRQGGFVDGIWDFDPAFFNISPREATRMDPQQRLLLEVAWETLEDSGHDPARLVGSPVGIFVGICTNDFLQMGCRRMSLAEIDPYFGTGSAMSVAIGRMSYTLGFQGPAVAVDTACSSSLVAIHDAIHSLRRRECRMALAGGVNAILTPEPSIYFCKVRALSPDGRCKTFDASADGYGRGEGCGMVALKRLSDAVADGDRILGLLRGSAVNHDGRTSGLTVPNKSAQQTLLVQAMKSAGIKAEDYGYLEAHGTGTPLGDPIEMSALGAAIANRRPADQPLIVGSAKTNIGHLEGAAGIAGLIKSLIALNEGVIPPHLHFNDPSPYIAWNDLNVVIPREQMEFKERNGTRIAGVSSFGLSGTNAHVIVEAAPKQAAKLNKHDRPVQMLCLSARTKPALKQFAAEMIETLASCPADGLSDVCYSANAGRSHFASRLAIRTDNPAEAAAALQSFVADQSAQNDDVLRAAQVSHAGTHKVAMLFTGQGAQFHGMGQELCRTQPRFRATIARCNEILRDHLETSLLDVLYGSADPKLIDSTDYTQPALFAVEYALADLWKSWGIEPAVVMGHSLGEYVAACVAGVFSLEDGLKLAAERGRLMHSAPGSGAMAAVMADETTVLSMVGGFDGEITIAAFNGPRSVVISGETDAITAACEKFTARGITTTQLATSHAFHSHLMEPILDDFAAVCQSITYAKPTIGLVSNVSGQLVKGGEATTADYWRDHVRQPVRFLQSVQMLDERGYDVFLEIGPQPTLIGMARNCLPAGGQLWLASLRRKRSNWQQMIESVREFYLRGFDVDWRAFDADYQRTLVDVPHYPFQRKLCVPGLPDHVSMAEVDKSSAMIHNVKTGKEAVSQSAPAHATENASIGDAAVTGDSPTGGHTDTAEDLLEVTADCYGVEWIRKPVVLEASKTHKPGTWLILCDRSGTGQQLVSRLQSMGQVCQVVFAGDTYEQIDDTTWHINPDSVAEFGQLFLDLADATPLPRRGIVHLWSLDASELTDDTEVSDVMTVQQFGTSSLLHLLHTMSRNSAQNRARLWLITKDAQLVGESDSGLGAAHATLWGMARSVALEYPEARCGRIDLSAETSPADLDSVITMLSTDETETQTAFRDGQRYSLRMRRLPETADSAVKSFTINADGSYLITGGLGGVGLLTARWLAENGARHIVLTGRSELNDETSAAIDDVRRTGCEVTYLRGDVSEISDASRIVTTMRNAALPLKGIIHAAGVLDDGPLLQQTVDRFQAVLRPKVMGAWNLHRLTRDLDLDFFSMFSSAVALIGGPGQANYSAGNAFLDALAHRRRQAGLVGSVVNWGPWTEAGMAARLGEDKWRRWNTLGINGIETEEGLAAYGHLLANDVTQACVMKVDWPKFFGAFPPGLEPPLLADLNSSEHRLSPPSEQWTELLDELKSTPESERFELMASTVDGFVRQVLGLDEDELLDREQGFFDFGMDSLMAVELRNRLQYLVGNSYTLPLTVVFDQPTVGAISRFLLDNVTTVEIVPSEQPSECQIGEQAVERDAAEPKVAEQGTAEPDAAADIVAGVPVAGDDPPVASAVSATDAVTDAVASLSTADRPAAVAHAAMTTRIDDDATAAPSGSMSPTVASAAVTSASVTATNRPSESVPQPARASAPTSRSASTQSLSATPVGNTDRRPAVNEPIAVIGMACRLPGGIRNVDDYWRVLHDGVDTITEVPASRWDVDAYFDADIHTPGHMTTRWGGFLQDVEFFDADFFGISAHEAQRIDPQHRMLLEVGWEALENANKVPAELRESRTGVFVGISGNDYVNVLQRACGPDLIDAHLGIGNALSAAAGRISHMFGFHGPALSVDTACSSSLVAIDLAIRALRQGDISLGLACGVNLTLAPEITISLSKAGVLARDGRCKTFDASADGYVRSEGCGVVVLKRLSDAQADGDTILGVIRGTCVNHDGRSGGLTWPNGPSQEMLLRDTLAATGTDPTEINYIEAHGTGTALGDQIELQAITNVLCRGRSLDNRLWVGSAKTNLGHLEATAGVAALIKVLLSFRNGLIPPHLHFEQPNPYIQWDQLPLDVPTAPTRWPDRDQPHLACVSAFGFSGTNAHLIVEEPVGAAIGQAAIKRPRHLLCLSGKTRDALERQAEAMSRHLETHADINFADVCYTAGAARQHFPHRLTVCAETADEARRSLDRFQAGESDDRLTFGTLKQAGKPKLAFLFAGLGDEVVGMAREFYETQPLFRSILDHSQDVVRPYFPEPLLDVLFGDALKGRPLNETPYNSAALFAVEYAIASMWRDWGAEPGILTGHSLGEFVAASIAGVFPMEDGLSMVSRCSNAINANTTPGLMVSVMANAERAAEFIEGYTDRVQIGGLNSPANTLLCGDKSALEEIQQKLRAAKVTFMVRPGFVGYHSSLMDPVLDEIEKIGSDYSFATPKLPLVSSVTGKMVGENSLGPRYLCDLLRGTVRFSDSMALLERRGYRMFLEIGPEPILLSLVRQCVADKNQLCLPTLRSRFGDWAQTFQSLTAMHLNGTPVNWKNFDRGYNRRWVSLPNYPFDKQRHWIDVAAPATPQPATGSTAVAPASTPAQPVERVAPARVELLVTGNPVLGRKLRSPAFKGTVFERRIDGEMPLFRDHQVYSMIVVPGAHHLAMALTAAMESGRDGRVIVEDVHFPEALILPDGESRDLQFIVEPDKAGDGDDERASFQLLSTSGEDDARWVLHARGRLRYPAEQQQLSSFRSRLADEAVESRNGDSHAGSNGDGPHRTNGKSDRNGQRGSNGQPSAAPVIDLDDLRSRCVEHGPDGRLFYQVMRQYGLSYGATFQWMGEFWRRSGEALARVNSPGDTAIQSSYAIPPGLIDGCFQLLAATLSGEASNDDAYIPVSVDRFDCFLPAATPAYMHVLLHTIEDSDGNSLIGDMQMLDADGRVIARISGVKSQRAPKEILSKFAKTRYADWLYRTEWTGQPREDVEDVDVSGRWMIFADSDQVGSHLAGLLGELGASSVRIHAGSDYQIIRDGECTINPSEPEHFERLFADAAAADSSPLQGVVYLWSLDAHRESGQDAATLENLGCGNVLKLVHCMGQTRTGRSPRLVLATRGTQVVTDHDARTSLSHAALWGLGRTISTEHPNLQCTRIDLQQTVQSHSDAAQLLAEIRSGSREDQIALRDSERAVARLIRVTTENEADDWRTAESYQLVRSEQGVIDDLAIRPMKRRAPFSGEVEIKVEATGLNFRDVLNALALYPGDAGPLGMECSGTVVAIADDVTEFKVGDRVVAFAVGCFGRYATADVRMTATIPDDLEFEAAATVPVTFVTAGIALREIAKVQPGERVLIHAAAGGVGLAAVQIALACGAEVFGTAGNDDKRSYLKSLGVSHVFNSRSVDFADQIKEVTDGQGVHVVLNSLARDFIPRSLEVMAENGRFVEIGKIEIWDKQRVAEFRPDVDYHILALDNLAIQTPDKIGDTLRELTAEFGTGDLQPLKRSVFKLEDAAEAFRFMAQAKHTGKIVVVHPELDDVSTSDAAQRAARRRRTGAIARDDGTYLITGGLGSLGLVTAEWLATRGARTLVLISRHHPAHADAAIHRIEQLGTQVITRECDVADRSQLTALFQEIQSTLPPLRGIIHAAGVVDDDILMRLDSSRFKRVMAPKVAGSLNLHELTKDMDLDWFAMYSSVSSVIGIPGQGNYAAANAFMDALAHHRTAAGLPGLSVNWGPWEDLGMAARTDERLRGKWEALGIGSLPATHALQALEALLREPYAQVGVMPIEWPKTLQRFPPGTEPPLLFNIKDQLQQAQVRSEAWLRLVEELKLAPPAERKDMIVEHMISEARRVLKIGDEELIDPRMPLNELGFDSLMAVELANQLSASAGTSLPVTLLFDHPTIDSLAGYFLTDVLEIEGSGSSAADENQAADSQEVDLSVDELADSLLSSIENMSDDEVASRSGDN